MKLIWCNGFPEMYGCILLYMQLLWCNGFPEIYAWLEEGVGSICHGYMCMLLYMKLIWCNGFSEIYTWLEGVHLSEVYVHSTICKMALVHWCCIDLLSIGGAGWGQSAMGIFPFCYIWNLCGVMVFQRSLLDWRRGWGQYTMGICAFCYIWNLFEEVYVHATRCKTAMV